MFGNILIDKFQCYIPLPQADKETISTLKSHIEGALGKHYPINAYKVWINSKYSRLSFWFTPTRYFKKLEEDINAYTDTNMDMPEEAELLEVFIDIMNNDVFASVSKVCKITKLDITKNFVMKQKPYEYIKMLKKRVYNNGYKAIIHTSGRGKNTLSITTLARNKEKLDKVGDREFIFYDKSKELEKRHLKHIALKKPLLPQELTDVPITSYYNTLNAVDFKQINILRGEWQFGSSRKLSALSKFLNLNKAEQGVYLPDFIDLMQKCKLYKSLDRFYTSLFFEILCYKPDKDIVPFDVYKEVLFEYFDIVKELPLDAVLEDNEILQKYNKLKLNLQSHIQNELFEELKNKVLYSHLYYKY